MVCFVYFRLELPKENEEFQEIIEKELNSPLLSEVNDSELPENPFAVKEKRCPKYRLVCKMQTFLILLGTQLLSVL